MNNYIQLALIAGGLLASLVLVRRRPKIVVVIWMFTVCFVPVWQGVTIRVYLIPTIAAGVYVLLVVLPTRIKALGPADLAIAFFALVCLVPVVVGGSSGPYLAVLLSQWMLAFSVGRVLPTKVDLRWIYGCVAVMFTAVAVLALIEFLTRWNPFVRLSANNRLFDTWAPILVRGGVPRVEGAFGHPIALGVSIAIAIPLVFASRFRPWLKLLMAAVMAVSIVPTFSRSAMICAGLAIVMSLFLTRDWLTVRVRTWAVLLIGAIAVALIPLVVNTFVNAGAEATGSAIYRGSLLSLVPRMSIIGFSTSALRNASGNLYFGNYKSIDSAAILLGLAFGWMALVVAVFLVMCAAGLVLRRRANAPTIAIVAAVPAVATVAFITQYGMFFWFIVGLAVYGQVESSSRRREELASDGHPQVAQSVSEFPAATMVESASIASPGSGYVVLGVRPQTPFTGSATVLRNI